MNAVFPEFCTKRLYLRALAPDDVAEIFILRSDPRVLQYLETEPVRHLDDARAFIEMIRKGYADEHWKYWVLAPHGQTGLAGTACIWNLSAEKNSGELGYALLPDFQSRGLMGEALEAVIDFGFHTLGLAMLEAYVHAENRPSFRLLERLGFERTGEKGALIMYERQR